MEVITPSTLTEALKDFRERGDERWASEDEVDILVEEYLANKSGLSSDDIAEILGSL